MGGYMKVGFAEIANAASSITSGASQVQGQLDDLQQQVTKTLAAWEGATQGAYQEAQAKWTQAATDLQEVLAAIGIAVQQAGEAYQAAEQKNTARW
ncbi:WXG100 family type VII secretion target [Lentzea sp. PSKA42]|uniref:ESAT-6-like protein n=1 Tax=Lentzea indica TaxID=2604800 RepID=A0ABX1FSC4_9PSEU|nr:WXG100 family type VII secretion target [Lentzea indica]NKE61930.1 WXG100 family type VII secretion target [Lentzea indica]